MIGSLYLDAFSRYFCNVVKIRTNHTHANVLYLDGPYTSMEVYKDDLRRAVASFAGPVVTDERPLVYE